MTEQQDVLSPKRRRRHGNTILLGSIPVAVALTALLTAGTWAAAPQPSQQADGPTAQVSAPEPMPRIVAAGTIADATVASPGIKVVLPPPPPVETARPAAQPASASAGNKSATAKKSTGTAKKSTAKKSTPKKSTAKKKSAKKQPAKANFKAYCANPKGPYSASGGAKALLSAANKERARLGIKKMSWSSSLAGAATKWSSAMAKKDDGTGANADALAHNPHRPGAENVAVSYVSNGLSQGGAIARAHKNWMYSNGHCLNIMNPAYSTMGAGAVSTSDGKTWYTTANFR